MFQQFLPPPIYKFVAAGGKIFFCTPKRQDWLWSKYSLLLSGYRGYFLGVKQPGRENVNSYPSRLRMCGGTPLLPLPYMTSRRGQGHFYLLLLIHSFIQSKSIHPDNESPFRLLTCQLNNIITIHWSTYPPHMFRYLSAFTYYLTQQPTSSTILR
jgi:hypothetical protein